MSWRYIVLFAIGALCSSQTTPNTQAIINELHARRYSEAREMAQQALKKSPNDERLWTLDGFALAHLGDTKSALASYQHALDLSPNYLPALEGAAEIEYNASDQRAVPLLNKILLTHPNDETIFTDHRIMRRPGAAPVAVTVPTELVAWREPPPSVAKRNLALAHVSSGLTRHFPPWIVRGYRMLTEIQTAFPDDVDVLNAFGTALLQGNQPQEAKFAFDRVLTVEPANASFEENAGRADLACGHIEAAVHHLEKALDMDPLLLSAAGVLEGIYRKQGDTAKQAALAERVREALKGGTVTKPQ